MEGAVFPFLDGSYAFLDGLMGWGDYNIDKVICVVRLERLKNILFAKYEKPPETIGPDGFVIFSQGLPEGDLANRSEVDGGCRHSEGLEHPAHGREAYAVAFLQP